ncbi:MAG: ABC transporter ATP-binding protein/permease [Bacteroidota bacterium]|nr:ABC transporter ATP-binding protein/permease [Bacteroidota bacterium]
MKSLRVIFRYVSKYPKLIFAYFSFNVLSNLFSVISLGLLSPFLLLIFKKQNTLEAVSTNNNFFSRLNPINQFKVWLYHLIQTPNGEVKALGIICILVLSAIILKNIFLYLSIYFLTPIRNVIINDMRTNMFKKILALPVGYFNDQKKGDIMSRLTNDLQDVESSIVNLLETIFREPVTIFLFFVYMIILSPQLTLFLLLFLPFSGLIIGRIGRSLKKQSTRVQEKLGVILSTIDETLGGIRIIKGFNAEKKQFKKFTDQNDQLFVIKNSANRRRDLASPVSETLGIAAVVAVLWYGGRLVLQNTFLDPGDFLAYIVIFSQVIQPLKSLSTASYNIRKGSASVERIEALLHEEVSITEVPHPKKLTAFTDCIEFKNVGFFYEDKIILENINLKIQKGKTIALVGSSGAGKSTLVDLVPRFHDVGSGELLIDGINIKEYSLESLRSQMGIVTQEAILFNDSISNNIALGKDDASEEEITEAAKIANAHNFIIHKEDGYETNIGERGNKLSGGEKQRATIARAVLKNPPILILDEATSSLDTESERLVQDAINNLMHNRTSIVIAHRLSTIRHADEIIVLQKGKIVERGTHDGLMASDGFYKKLVMMQEVK